MALTGGDMSGRDLPGVLGRLNIRFDLRQRTLSLAGKSVFLDVRSALVFDQLLQNFGEVVSKDALLAAAWSGRLVHENSLAKAISRLRAVLRGSGLEIRASYGFGYLLAEVSANDPEVVSRDQPAQRVSASRLRKAAAPLALLFSIAAAVVAASNSFNDVPIRTSPPQTNDPVNPVANILWVDDHPSNNQLEVEYFKRRELAVHLAENTDDALKLLAMNNYDLVISDLGRGADRLAGLRLAKIIREGGNKVPFMIYTYRPKTRDGQQAQRKLVEEAGATDLAVTPVEVRSKVEQMFAGH